MEEQVLPTERLRDVERVVAIVCRRNALYGADGEDFASYVKIRLIENDCRILRKFEERSSFTTYISVVISRFLLDYRNQQLGKWRPSAAAKHLGTVAVSLERLIHRDRRTLEDAIRELALSGHDPKELRLLAGKLPARFHRTHIPLDDAEAEFAVQSETVEQRLSSREQARIAGSAGAIVRAVVSELPMEDRRLFKLHFDAGLTVAEIARSLHVEQKPIYRKVKRVLTVLRKRLEAAGIGEDQAEELIVTRSCDLDFGLGEMSDSRPSMSEGTERVTEGDSEE
jgi:RNA polymerase sigma factor for flagellar operon FliA